LTETFIEIVQKSKRKEIIPFLQSLSPQDRKALVPELKKQVKEHLTYRERNGTWRQKANERQRIILLYTAFVCYNLADFEKFPIAATILAEEQLEEVISWYCPTWFNDYVNRLARGEFMVYTMNYGWMMQLNERGLITPSPELVVRLLPQFIHKQVDRRSRYAPENLLLYPATLTEHIWYLFELESSVHAIGLWNEETRKFEKDTMWMAAFKHYVTVGKLDRMRVLKESLLASNRNFNKLSSGWFADLFNNLEPTKEELLLLQKELFSLLGASHSKPVNTALQYIKKIQADKQFTVAGFLDYTPVLLASSTKSTVAAALMVLEKLAARHADSRQVIVQAVMQVFVHADDDLQQRAARIIESHQAVLDGPLQEELMAFAPSMLTAARKTLETIIAHNNPGTEPATGEEETIEETPATGMSLPVIDSIDELVFMASQAFDNNQSWHIDLLPAALLHWVPLMQGTEVAKLEPALQRALQLMKQGVSSQQGRLDHMLSVFFIDVCVHLLRSRGTDAGVLDRLFTSYRMEDKTGVSYWQRINPGTSYLADWRGNDRHHAYLPYKRVLQEALFRIRKNSSLPLMSTPTHEPAWIAPVVLVERLWQHQQAGQWPDEMDLQIALARCNLHETTEAVTLAEERLQEEYRDLCLFLFGRHEEPQGPITLPGVWMAASLSRPVKKQYEALRALGCYHKSLAFYTGQHEWEPVIEEYIDTRYDYKLGKTVKEKALRKVLQVHVVRAEKKEEQKEEQQKDSGIKGLFRKLMAKPKQITAALINTPALVLYDQMELKSQYFFVEHNDIRRLLLLAPCNPEPLLSWLLISTMKEPVFSSEFDKRTVIAALQALHEIWDRPGNMAHLFIGTAMIASDKTVAGIAGEIWLQQAPSHKIDSALLGKVIGLYGRIEFMPMKRLTDLMTQKLMRISPAHNKCLQVMTEHILQELPDEPVRNLKKLLEIYGELLHTNKMSISNTAVAGKIKIWSNNTTLKKAAGQLLAAL